MTYNPNYGTQGQYPPPQQGQYAPPQGYPPPQGQYPPPQGQYQQQGPYMPQQGVPSQQPASFYQQDAYGNKQAPSPSQHQYQGTSSEKTPWNPSQQSQPYSGPDVAGEDVDENGVEEQITASAPSYDLVISGYENVAAATDAPVGPPPAYETLPDIVPATVDSSRIPAMSSEVAREALLELVAQQACWGKGAAKDMKIKDIQATNAYHYVLETYTEGRTTRNAHVPYKGGYVDGPHNGAAPLPWDIPCSPTALFKTEQHKITVPHTEVVRPCHLCWGRGFNRCRKCRGRGRVRCGFCSGSGHRSVYRDGRHHNESCSSCHGHGRKRCYTCHGSGCVICIVCSGYGSLKQFIQLTVCFTNRHSDHVVERSDLPSELIINVEGDTIFEQTLPRVGAIENFFEQDINHKSRELVSVHAHSWPAERVLQQRHYLRSVPVHECHFEFNDKPGRFWVYGNNKEVHTTDYPHTCCCCQCCSIL